MDDVYLVGGVRTPVGRFGGGLAGVRADDLAALVVGEAARRSGVPAGDIDDVVLGAANQAGDDNRNVARMAVLLTGFPDTVPGYTVNRLCASGLQAVASAGQAIASGTIGLAIAGGVESMTRAPWVMAKPPQAWARPGEVADSALGWRFVNPRMTELDGGDATMSLGECTEKLATLKGITREDADEYAARSQALVAAAVAAGHYAEETIPVETRAGALTADETVREGTTVGSLADFLSAKLG